MGWVRERLNIRADFQILQALKDLAGSATRMLRPQCDSTSFAAAITVSEEAASSIFSLPIFQLSNKGHSIHYYNVIIALFHSHVGPRPEAHVPPMSKVLNANESPHQILTEAKAFLETLVRLYYLRHSFESYSPMMSHFLSLQSFMSIDQLKSANTDETTTKAIHSTIILATKGMRDQARSSHLAQTLSQLIYRKLDPLIASTIKESLLPDEAETDNAQMLLHVKSTFPVNIIGISDDPEKQRLDELIKEIIGVDVDSDSEMSSREITPQLAEK